MVSPSLDPSAPAAVPRHARDDDAAGSRGRHRRPESLADSGGAPFVPARTSMTARPHRSAPTRDHRVTGTRHVPDPRVPAGHAAGLSAGTDAHPADEAIREARRAASRVSRAREEAAPRSGGRRRAANRPRHSHRPAGVRGRHAMPPDPMAITVRPLHAPDDVRGWEPAAPGRRPVIGSRRAPGTWAIESWLLAGKARQQVLLAAVVAAGLALVTIPATQRGGDEVPVNTAGNAVVRTVPSRAPAAKAPAPAGRPPQRDEPAPARTTGTPAKPAASAPAAATPPSAASSAPAEPPVVVPAGDGPFRSWRTTGSSAVALTFDDGPDPVQTPRILGMLAEHGVKATFCLVGAQVERHPEIVARIAADGHTLCNHTWDHSLTIGGDDPAVIEADLARTNQAIRAAVPDAEIPFFRAPGGNFSDPLVQTAYRAGMTSLYWEVDPRDWEHAPDTDDATHVARIVEEVRRAVRPGAIVLSHDFNQPGTIDAYAELLPWLTANFALGVPAVPEPPADR
jgi:peptidoglycan/xylan/chitin deacetylase (PgdA/CDA1 family)